MVLGPLGDHDAVDQDAGDLDLARVAALPRSAMRSTCTMTMPPQLCAAMAIDSASSVSASRSIVRLPSGSAVVPRTMPTLIGNVW